MKQVVQDYLNHLRLGGAQRYTNMALFPLLCNKEGKQEEKALNQRINQA